MRLRLGEPDRMMAEEQTTDRIRRVIVESLHLDGVDPASIGDDDPLFGEGLGLDSVDALELIVALEKEYGVKIDSEDMGQEAFGSVSHLAKYVDGLRGHSA